MAGSASFRNFFKATGLALTALVYLGSIEFSAYLGSADNTPPIRGAHINHLPMVTDDVLGETEEESNSEARKAVFLLAEMVFLPESVPGRGYLLPERADNQHSFQKILSRPRGPPAF